MDWRSLPPLAALRAFAAYVDQGNVQAAGAALNVSHAAISQHLRSLEDHLGLPLFDRSGRSMELTSEGRLLAEAATAAFGQLTQAVAELTGSEALRPLHVTTTTSFATTWLMPRLPLFREICPQVDLILAPGPARQDPEPGGIDLAIRYGAGQWPGLEAEPFLISPIVGVAKPGLVPPGTSPKDLTAFQWLEEIGSHEASAWLAQSGAGRPKAGLITGPGHLLLDAARAGQGIAVTTRVAAEADIAAGRLEVLFEQDAEKGYFLVMRAGVQRPALKSFVAWLRREARGG